MACKAISSAHASSDLQSILDYISIDLANPTAAKQFLDNYNKSIELICEYPFACHSYFNKYIKNSNLRYKSIGNYLMFYEVNIEQKLITIVRIIHSNRKIDSLIDHLSDSGKK